MLLSMLRLAKILILILFTNTAYAKCNFSTSDFLYQLGIPKNIKSIEIETPKSSKYYKNFLKIIRSKSDNINPKLKISFKSKIIVNYDFGKCTYNGSVRQLGDWKDHIQLENGIPVRSLKVSIENGNILNAVKFKLLIPSTRGNLNEVLGAMLIRELGFIAPETFQVQTIINNFQSQMLFQEDSRKELLERNKKREGPIFEGDESLLWSYKNFLNQDLEPLSLSRVKNEKWFLKGKNSQIITLDAYSQLQKAYLNYSYEIGKSRDKFIIQTIDQKIKKFNDYFMILLAMNGTHGLRPHNRQYYYNIFTQKLEPIYYDGNLNLNAKINLDNTDLDLIRANEINKKLQDKINLLKENKSVFAKFDQRVLINQKEALSFYKNSLKSISINLSEITKKLTNVEASVSKKKTFDGLLNKYLNSESLYKINQVIFTQFEYSNQNYLGKTLQNKQIKLSPLQVSEIISRNKIGKNRAIFIPDNHFSKWVTIKRKIIQKKNGEILHTEGLKVFINLKKKEITFNQTKESDWVLLRNLNLDEWKIIFIGIKIKRKITKKQRFNSFGLTGCMNFYNTSFKNVIIESAEGICEDSINIVDSIGNLKNIVVKNAYGDAIDLDFSKLSIDNIEVDIAGNDCLDVSAGNYQLKKVKMAYCGDKGISVGEKSKMKVDETDISHSKVAISSKDYSETKIKIAKFKDVEYCYEAKQKKVEFGGSVLRFQSFFCNEKYFIDKNSKVLFN